MSQSSQPESDNQGGRHLSPLALASIFFVLACTIISAALGVFILSQNGTAPAAQSEAQALPPAPTTPPIFGLSGQASCRRLDPPTDSSWLSVAREDAQKYQIDILAFEWQIWQESKFDPNAISPDNAIGIAQFEPDTAASLGIDPTNPQQSLDAAAHLDSERLSQYAARASRLAGHYGGASAHYAFALVLAAYNAGIGAVETAWSRAFSSQGAQVWPSSAWAWLDHMPNETRGYVPAILGCL